MVHGKRDECQKKTPKSICRTAAELTGGSYFLARLMSMLPSRLAATVCLPLGARPKVEAHTCPK
jgi:hypothetical protein